MPRHRTIIAVLIATLLSMAAARGQQITDISGPYGMPVGTTSLNKYFQILNLDADQKQLVRTLYQGYRAAFKQAVDTSNKEIESLEKERREKGGGENRMNEGMECLQRFAAQTTKIEQEFFDDFKTVLKPEQGERFVKVERARRREAPMRFAFVAGEGADLNSILEQLKVTPAGELAGICDEYESAIDHLMIEKHRVMRASLAKVNKIQKAGLPDFELVGNIITDLYGIGGRIRDTNRQFVRRMEPLLPEAQQAPFNAAFKKLSFPRVYKPTLVHKCLAAGKELEDLSPEQRTGLESIGEAYAKELEVANQHFAAAIESTQERFPKEFLAILQSRFNPDKSDALSTAREERKELDQRMFARMKGLLKPEQFKKLPQFDPDEDHDFPEFLPNMRTGKEWEKWKSEDA